MPQTNSFYSKKHGEIYFNLVKITTEEQKVNCTNFSEKAGYVHGSGGVGTFQNVLTYYDNLNTDVWVAYVASNPIIDPDKPDLSGLEMYVTVSTSEHSLFTSHMGIQRVPCESPHKNIATLLHEFCANIMDAHYPDKLFMLTSPEPVMREILLKEIKAKGKGDSVYIYDMGEELRPIPAKFLAKKQLDLKNFEGSRIPLKLSAEVHLLEDLIEQRTQIAEGKLFPVLSVTKLESYLLTISDRTSGETLSVIPEENPEFNWFYEPRVSFFLGIQDLENALLAIKLPVLGHLTGSFDTE